MCESNVPLHPLRQPTSTSLTQSDPYMGEYVLQPVHASPKQVYHSTLMKSAILIQN
jgi:hypothetical protein